MNEEVGQPVVSEAAPGRLGMWQQALRNYINECVRVLKITKKPTMFEFKTIVKVSALGLLLIGFIGFAVFLIAKLVI
ncbi:MAG: protein translocase SEC61 complex subunit gamma [Candidatus Woesearchaeota archaeon]|nr:protein translocase SEC61 complex subunit gamma [Candidatus Woesearchaeota archaeon]